MERRFDLGQAGGWLTVREEGGRAIFEAALPDDRRGLYKAHITGEGGGMLLGTLLPEQGRLQLRRTIAISELKQRGCWPVTGGEARLAFAFGEGEQQCTRTACPAGWAWEDAPSRLMGDGLLAHCAGGLGRTLICREPEGFALAVPFVEKTAFPMTPLVCFASIERLGERYYAVFHFNSCGCPVFQNKEKQRGNTVGVNQKKE